VVSPHFTNRPGSPFCRAGGTEIQAVSYEAMHRRRLLNSAHGCIDISPCIKLLEINRRFGGESRHSVILKFRGQRTNSRLPVGISSAAPTSGLAGIDEVTWTNVSGMPKIASGSFSGCQGLFQDSSTVCRYSATSTFQCHWSEIAPCRARAACGSPCVR